MLFICIGHFSANFKENDIIRKTFYKYLQKGLNIYLFAKKTGAVFTAPADVTF